MAKVTAVLNARRFENLTGKKHRRTSVEAYDLDGVYERPSATKREIWEDWLKWADELEKMHPSIEYVSLWINSHSAQVFIIGGKIVYTSGDIAHIYISPARQEYWED